MKFVIETPNDIDEVRDLQAAVPIPAEDIVLMPQGLTSEETRPRLAWLADACTEHGYRLSPRLHVDIWGTGRGV